MRPARRPAFVNPGTDDRARYSLLLLVASTWLFV
jgi:hypothetical protein